MQKTGTYRLLIIGVALLVALNLATLGTLWFSRREPAPPAPHADTTLAFSPIHRLEAARRFIARELQFSDVQQQELLRLQQEYTGRVRGLFMDIRQTRAKMLPLLTRDSVQASEIQAVAAELGHKQESLFIATTEYFRAIRALCNEQQQRSYTTIIDELTQMLGAPGAGPPFGGRPPGKPGMPPGGFPPPEGRGEPKQ